MDSFFYLLLILLTLKRGVHRCRYHWKFNW